MWETDSDLPSPFAAVLPRARRSTAGPQHSYAAPVERPVLARPPSAPVACSSRWPPRRQPPRRASLCVGSPLSVPVAHARRLCSRRSVAPYQATSRTRSWRSGPACRAGCHYPWHLRTPRTHRPCSVCAWAAVVLAVSAVIRASTGKGGARAAARSHSDRGAALRANGSAPYSCGAWKGPVIFFGHGLKTRIYLFYSIWVNLSCDWFDFFCNWLVRLLLPVLLYSGLNMDCAAAILDTVLFYYLHRWLGEGRTKTMGQIRGGIFASL
jgi:hypothetical protein